MGPLVYRLAFQPLADASVLILFIAAIGVHLAMSGLGLAVFGAEGSRLDPMLSGMLPVGPIMVKMQSLAVLAVTAAVMAGLYFCLRAHAPRQGLARDRGQPARRAARRRARRRNGADRLRARRRHRRALGHPHRPVDHGRLRHRLSDRPQGLRRGDHRRARELSHDGAGRARHRPPRILLGLLRQRLQGGDRLRRHHPVPAWRSYAAGAPPTKRTSEPHERSRPASRRASLAFSSSR